MSSIPPPSSPVPWYEKVFKIQMLLLLLAAAVGGPLFVLMNPMKWPWPQFAWIVPVSKVVFAVVGPVVGGVMAIQLFRHILWLFGRRPFVETWIGPPPRANCVIMMFASAVIAGIGFDRGGFVPITSSLLGGSIWFFFSLTGFLWAQAEARKSCQKDAM